MNCARWMLPALLLLSSANHLLAARPLVEGYLHRGDLKNGELELQAALQRAPKDDQIRYGLGVLQLVQSVERLGQSLYEYGIKPHKANVPFLRLPVPRNPHPAPIDYRAFRRVMDDFLQGLGKAEATLAGITSDDVKLTLRLADVRLDFDGDGKATDKLNDVLKRIFGRDPAFLSSDPAFRVSFDRGDVAWLRAYCHTLSSVIDVYLTFDTQLVFYLWSNEMFTTTKRDYEGNKDELVSKLLGSLQVVKPLQPKRLARFRRRVVTIARLNRETWKHILAETDDDHEWLPNPKQQSVLGLPVRKPMIDGWLAMMAELEATFEGKRSVGTGLLGKADRGINLKVLLDDPPKKLSPLSPQSLDAKYFSNAPEVNHRLFRVGRIFEGATAMGYSAWFN